MERCGGLSHLLPRNTAGERQGEVRVQDVQSREQWGGGKPRIIQKSVEASLSWGRGWSHCFLLSLQAGRKFFQRLSALPDCPLSCSSCRPSLRTEKCTDPAERPHTGWVGLERKHQHRPAVLGVKEQPLRPLQDPQPGLGARGRRWQPVFAKGHTVNTFGLWALQSQLQPRKCPREAGKQPQTTCG